jgi:hypothetical protein
MDQMHTYVTDLIVKDRIAELRREAANEALVRTALAGRPARPGLVARLLAAVRRTRPVGQASVAGTRATG